MKLELTPDITNDGSGATHQTADHAGFTKDGLYSWVYKDSLLEIIYAKTNEIFADWRFGKAIKDKNTIISCVTEFDCSEGRMLLVATENLSDEGTLCLFSFSKKRVVRAIEFTRKIRAVEVIFNNSKEDVPEWILSKHLHFFYGLAAVGTEGGYTYLVDLRLDDVMLNPTNEIQVKKLTVYSPGLIDPKTKRDAVCSNNKHMAVLIDSQCHTNEQFYYRRQDDSIDKVYEEDAVCVTSLKYLNQAGILAVGFNFGCFQLWRIHTPVLDYSTRFTPDSNAVSSFVVQEPENDPRNLVYLWVGRDESVMGEEHGHGKLSTISLYQLCFNKKDTYPGFGLFYEDLESVCGRLDHKLQVNPYLGGNNKTTWSSQIICAYTIINPVYTPPVAYAHDSFEEGSHGNDLSLSVFVWKADSKQSGHSPSYWMAIFDLNRWYHAQMPHSIRCHGNVQQVCPYWAVYKLDDIVAFSYPQSLLHVQMTGNNILKFSCKSPLPPEEHSFPSALEITDVRFITPQRTVKGHCYGWQGQLLQELVREGAMHLVTPDSFYHQCMQARLIPQSYSDTKTVEHQRKALLNLSLDYNLTVRLIHKCIQTWMDGEFVDAGCTLALLLDWAWQTVARIKGKLDSTCEILYDCSGRTLDPYTDWLIRRHFCSLSSLKQVFTIFLTQPNAVTVRGHEELEMRLEVLRLLVEHHNMVQWCLIEGLLPEIKEGSTQLPGLFAYPYSDLYRATNKRRAEFKALKGVVTNHSLLLIDGLVKCAGPQLATIWQRDDEDDLYPPTSMQALMNLFLLEDILLEVKHAIMLYFLQDLAVVLGCNDEDRQNVVVSFVRSFGILPSLVHTIHGLWCIDHRDYEEGLRQLVNPNVQPHVWSSWMDVSVINTLLAQGQEATAARYMCSGHSLGATLEEQKLNIAVLVRNRKVSAAVDYMRQRCYHKKDPSDLMPFLLRECQNNKMIGQLLQLHLLQVEEMEVEKYLRDRSEPQALEPLLLYYLTHSRFVEAFTLNEEMNKLDKLEATCPAAREKAANRNRLMEAYLRVLPDITRKVLMEKQHRPNVMGGKRVEVLKPKPLSTMVYKKEPHILSRSHLIMAVMDKVEEAMNAVEDYEQEGGEPVASVDMEDKNRSVYVATPLTPRHKSFLSLAQTPEAMTYPEEASPSPLPTNPLSAAKRKLNGLWEIGEEREKNSLSALTKECLDLLKTPIKGSSTSGVSPRASLAAMTVKTPQSILKVRRLSKTLLRSESRKTPDSIKKPKKLGFSASDSSITSPSSPSLEIKTVTTAATPKQLRFVGISPSPTPSPSPLPVRSKESPLGTDTSQSSVSEQEESQHMKSPDSAVEVRMEVENEETDEDKAKGTEREEIRQDNIGEVAELKDAAQQESAVQEVHLTESEELMETNQNENEKQEERASSSSPTGKIKQQTITKSLDLTETEHMTAKAFDVGSADRYDDEMDHLVRPDLQSPWKHNLSSEEVVTVEENNVTLHLTPTEGEVMTPTMTSSPLDETVEKQIDKTLETNVPIISAMEMIEKENVSRRHLHDDGSKDADENTTRELHRNVLKSLVAPRLSEPKSSLSSIGLYGHMRLSAVSSLSVETTTTTFTERSLRSKDETSPEKVITKLDSPPATPPLSKKAKMIVKGTRKSRFNLVTPRRELRSTRSSERHLKADVSIKSTSGETEVERTEDVVMAKEIGDEILVERKSERKSPSRSLKRKAADEDEHEEAFPQEDSILLSTRSRRTPIRKSPSRSTRKKTDEAEDEVKNEGDKNKNDEESNEVADDVAQVIQKSVRRSPSRAMKRKADTESDNDDNLRIEQEQDLSMVTRLRSKTPERRSPARSTRKKAADKNELEEIKESADREQAMEKMEGTLMLSVKKNSDDRDKELESSMNEDSRSVRHRKTPERKSPSRSLRAKKVEIDLEHEKEESVKKTSEQADTEPESSSNEDKQNRSMRQRKTPERKSPSRSLRGKKSEADAVDQNVEHEEEHSSPERISSRLRSSPARNTSRSKTPERKIPTRKTHTEKQIIEEVITEDVQFSESKNDHTEKENAGIKVSESENEVKEKEVDVDEEFTPGEEFISKLDKEPEMAPPLSPSRRRSSRLNTPERGTKSSHMPEPSRRSSRGRTTSVSSTTLSEITQASEMELIIEKKSSDHVTRSKSPDKVEDEHSLRRSRRQSRTPERFRTEIGESTSADKNSKDEIKSTPPKGQRSSPARKSTPQRGKRSPGRSTTSKQVEEMEFIEEQPTIRRNLTDALEVADDKAKKDLEEGKQEGVWNEELPPLRLEAEDEGDSNDKAEETKSNIAFKEMVTHSQLLKVTQSIESVPSTSFVFSDPVMHEDDIPIVKGHENVDKPDHDFVFSLPTVADTKSEKEKQATSRGEKTEKRTTRTKSKRQRKNLLDSPDLLPLSESFGTEQSKKERSRVRMSDIQKASASVLRRYSRRSGPITRRLVPRSYKSEQQN